MNGVQVAALPSVWQMYRSMVGVGLLCGLLIVTVFLVTRPVIERNKAEALQRAIFQVLPDARSTATFRLDGQAFAPLEGEAESGELVYAGYAEDGRLVGLAVEAQGMGYQDVIRILYGYSFSKEAVVGIRVLESKETPGLGDKIETDDEFLKNFERLDVSLTDESEIANPIVFVKHGRKTESWQVDGITGATISSKAIAGILERSTAYWIPKIRRGLDDFRRVG
jgi:electron transport complex protein RnfG